jgi:SAM-dependent methyltransferase
MAVHESEIRSIFKILPDNEMREVVRTSLNRLPDPSDWIPGECFTDILRSMGQPVTIHRKAWEYGIAIQGLRQLGVVTPTAKAIAVGAGTEPVLYYFANHIERMVATDLYESPDHEGTPAMLDDPQQFAPFPYPHGRLEVYRMSGDKLEFQDDVFDFAFCLSSIEHFGSRETQAAALNEMIRVVKPGGILCIITELILCDGLHDEYFTWEELEQMFLKHPAIKLVGGEPDFRISESVIRYPVDLSRTKFIDRSPHITLHHESLIWTSFSMFLERIS